MRCTVVLNLLRLDGHIDHATSRTRPRGTEIPLLPHNLSEEWPKSEDHRRTISANSCVWLFSVSSKINTPPILKKTSLPVASRKRICYPATRNGVRFPNARTHVTALLRPGLQSDANCCRRTIRLSWSAEIVRRTWRNNRGSRCRGAHRRTC